MAHDPGVAELLRGDLADLEDLDERRMFGALGFMWGGHLLCAALAEGAMIRVGKPGMEAALALPGVAPMRTGVREMGGFVAVLGAFVAFMGAFVAVFMGGGPSALTFTAYFVLMRWASILSS